MQTIKQHIKQDQYKPVYLLYGTEPYLKKLYRDKLRAGILAGQDDMNYACFAGKAVQAAKVRDLADTMPFFADRRLIVLEESGWFKSSSGFETYLHAVPQWTHLVFVESEVDKRGKLYKAVKASGYASEMNGLDERNLLLFAASLFQKAGLRITEEVLGLFLESAGHDMYRLVQEAEKLSCYCLLRGQITAGDIRAICSDVLEGRLFVMIDEIACKRKHKALSLYYDLIALREKPMSVLYLLLRHFHLLLQVKELAAVEKDRKVIAAKASVPPFAVQKYLSQALSFSKEQILQYMEYGIQAEEQIKTGRLAENIGVEMVILTLSS